MKLFSCGVCGSTVHFDSIRCEACGTALGFAPDLCDIAMFSDDSGLARDRHGGRWRRCVHNTPDEGCNWLVAEADDDPWCRSCRLNRVIPNLANPDYRRLWKRLEEEKRRFVYSALRLGLPITPQSHDPQGLAFDFLADGPGFSERVLTGHAGGVITINIAEADPVERERMRQEMDEPYRTILGHFRHESGHYYWDRLVRDTDLLEPYRALFGDERADYGGALQAHYENGPPADWGARFISAYAACHPWEDWAESWSHYFHMVDTLETAFAYGMRLTPRTGLTGALSVDAGLDPYETADFDALLAQWMPLTLALNSLSRSMGHAHAYPFALASPVIDKLRFVHHVIQGCVVADDVPRPAPEIAKPVR
jgi:hypothetical protein